ncbi:50S ribosomal protein L18 [Ignavibacteria bacterium]|jgi:large subunit ribosomal protein L18|nr:50S ribosomal protein L18 [Bacteroidota bacterium]MCZ2132888.1 50S ribosomal protein L18 [Bacteroidota bacterium]
MSLANKDERRERRKKRVRKKIFGTPERPRLTVFRSLGHIYAQIVDDTTSSTIVSASSVDKDIRGTAASSSKSLKSKQVGVLIAQRALVHNITKVAFDRNGYIYHGRVKALADAAREAGLEF